jgi:single-strand DNA-binding protein
MPALNKVLLMGNLTRDPELRVTPKGTPVCQFALAINRKWKAEDGSEKEEVVYVDVEAWGKQGETIAKYTTKGRPLYVEGRLRLDQWEDKNTKEKRSRMKIVLEQFQFLGDGRAAQAGGAAPESGTEPGPSPERHAPPARNAAPAKAPEPAAGGIDEDVPF